MNKCYRIGEEQLKAEPIPMILYCPSCHTQHIDKGEWETKEHRSHQCESCGSIWRPADVATIGVREIKTKGSQDIITISNNMEILLDKEIECITLQNL